VSEAQLSASEWWRQRRLRYNIILLAAAPISLVCLFTVWWLFEARLPCLEITGFTLAAGTILFIIGLAVANVAYFLGVFAERICAPKRVLHFRRRLYLLGTAFSVVLIFSPVIGNLAAAAVGPSSIERCK
jgi:hypothetical protein